MDRIRKALDLARMERPHTEAAPRLEPVATVEQPSIPPHVVQAGTITYSLTKRFKPPAEHLERNRIMSTTATGAAPAAYRMLRTQVLQRMDARVWRSLAVFSPGPRDGKTTTAINLAVSLASGRRHTVLLVDLDFKRPSLAPSFALQPEFGVDDVLSGHAKLQDCLYHPEGFERLVLLPARSTLGNSSEILAGPHSRDLVAELRGRYKDRIIIFDLPPVLNADDALAFAPLVEAGLVVAAEGRTRRNDLVRTIELLSATPLVGTVLNRAADTPSGY
ncbi:MAG: CpsD/CapB family tyrosine-protein kinase [Steroidobacteraceae bacterium]|jgi:Mrp family chromosome partitioning ATPase